MRWAWAVVAAVVGAPLSASAQAASAQAARGVLAARVVDATGRPLADAEVVIVTLDQRLRAAADGTARFVGVPLGTYDVTVRRVGYVPRTVRIATSTDTSGTTVYTVVAMVAYTTPPSRRW